MTFRCQLVSLLNLHSPWPFLLSCLLHACLLLACLIHSCLLHACPPQSPCYYLLSLMLKIEEGYLSWKWVRILLRRLLTLPLLIFLLLVNLGLYALHPLTLPSFPLVLSAGCLRDFLPWHHFELESAMKEYQLQFPYTHLASLLLRALQNWFRLEGFAGASFCLFRQFEIRCQAEPWW